MKLKMFFHFLQWKDFKKGIRYAIRNAWSDAVWAYNFHKQKVKKPDYESEHEIFND